MTAYIGFHHDNNNAYEVRLENKFHNTGLNSLYFSLGADSGYSFNGLYAGLTFNYQAGAAINSYNEFIDFRSNKVP
jgi:hypothetical protein